MIEPTPEEVQRKSWTSAPKLAPNPAAEATVEKLRLSEVQSIHRKLGVVCKADRKHWWSRLEWDTFFGVAAVLGLGGFVGGLIALIPFLDTEPSRRTRYEYYAVLGGGLLIAVLCVIAYLAIRSERATSVAEIHDEVGDIVERYKTSLELAELELKKAAAGG